MNVSSLSGALCASVFAFMSTATHAAFIDIGGGLIYDDKQDLTWTKDAGLSGWVNWQEATDWAANLMFGGVGGWRLPTTIDDDPSCGWDARNAGDFNLFFETHVGCTGGEMEQLSAEAGKASRFTGTFDNAPFENVNKTRYWTATPYREDTNQIDPCIYFPSYDVPCNKTNDNGNRTGFYWQWGFSGFKDTGGPNDDAPVKYTMAGTNDRYAWAVHDGRVGAVPVPAAIYLFGSGLVGLFGMLKRKAG